MQILRLLTAVLVSASPLVASAQTQVGPVAVVSGDAAFADFESVSADGCEHISGQLFLIQARTEFQLANGVYVTGLVDDSCTGAEDNLTGFADGTFEIPLLLAHHKGTVNATKMFSGAPVTVELDFWWLGSGALTPQHGVVNNGSTIDFSFSGERAATTRGRFTIDGQPATVKAAKMVTDTQGQVTLPQP
jgi:hypothetical protein